MEGGQAFAYLFLNTEPFQASAHSRGMNHFFISLTNTKPTGLYSSRENAEVAPLLEDLRRAWEGKPGSQIGLAETALQKGYPKVYQEYLRVYQNPSGERKTAIVSWCNNRLAQEQPEASERTDHARISDFGSQSGASEGRSVQHSALLIPLRHHPVEKLLSRKTLREPQKGPEPGRHMELLEKKLSIHPSANTAQAHHPAKGGGKLTIKASWRELINNLRNEADRETARRLQAGLERIVQNAGKKVDTGFLSAMCACPGAMNCTLERFRKNEEQEFELLKEMVELDLHKSASSLCCGKGFISRQAFNDLKKLREQYGKTIQQAITGMYSAKGEFNRDAVDEFIKWCTFNHGIDVNLLRRFTSMQCGKGMLTKREFDRVIEECKINGELEPKLLRSVAGMYNSRGTPEAGAVEKLKQLCTIGNELDLNFLSSVTGLQAGKGMLEPEKLKRLLAFCTPPGDKLDKKLFRSITGMLGSNSVPAKPEHFEKLLANLRNLRTFCSTEKGELDTKLFSSITGMQAGRGMPRQADLDQLKAWCTIDGKLDKNLFSSVTGMQNGKGMPHRADIDQLKAWCTIDGKLDTKLFSSVTGMQAGRGMPDRADIDQLKAWCTIDGKLDKDLFSSVTGMQNGKGMPDMAHLDQLKAGCTTELGLNRMMLISYIRLHSAKSILKDGDLETPERGMEERLAEDEFDPEPLGLPTLKDLEAQYLKQWTALQAALKGNSAAPTS